MVSYYLTQAGVDNVVVDARTIGLGSTCASTSLLQYEIDTPLCRLQHMRGLKDAVRSYKLCDESIDKLEAIAKKIRFPEFEKTGSLYYAAYKKDMKFIKEEFEIRKRNGFDVALLNEEQIKNKFDFNAPNAILSAQGAQTNAYSFPNVAFKPEFSWAGTFGSTKNGLPFIGHYSKLKNGCFALGFGGNGITFSLIAAEILTDLLQGKQNKDAQLFSFDRT